jgi:hypothetical protein
MRRPPAPVRRGVAGITCPARTGTTPPRVRWAIHTSRFNRRPARLGASGRGTRRLASRLEPPAPRPIIREPCGRLNQSSQLWNALSRVPLSPPTGNLSEVNPMKPTIFVLPAVAALLFAATGANAASSTFSGTVPGSPTLGPPPPIQTNPGAIGGSPQSLQPIPNGGLGSGLGYAPSGQTYGTTTGTAESSIFSPNASGSSTSGSSTSEMSAGG